MSAGQRFPVGFAPIRPSRRPIPIPPSTTTGALRYRNVLLMRSLPRLTDLIAPYHSILHRFTRQHEGLLAGSPDNDAMKALQRGFA
jgi:hypothetical protein